MSAGIRIDADQCSHLHRANSVATYAPKRAPEQATFLKPTLPASRQKHPASTYLRNPYSIGPSSHRDRVSPNAYGSGRHRVESDPYAVPETEDDERDGSSAVARKILHYRAPRLDQPRRRSDVDVQEDDSLITPDSVKKAGYLNGQRQAPFTTPKEPQSKKPSNELNNVPRPQLLANHDDDIVDDVSPELGARARKGGVEELQREPTRHDHRSEDASEEEEHADDEATQPPQRKLHTPFDSFSAKQRPQQLQKPSPQPSAKKLKPIKTRLLDPNRLPAGAADAHVRLQTATNGRAHQPENKLRDEQSSDEEEDEVQPQRSSHQRDAKAQPKPSLQVPATSQVGPRSVRDTVPNTYTSESTQKITQSSYGTQKARDDALRQEGRELYRAHVQRQKDLRKKPNDSVVSDSDPGPNPTASKSTTAGRMTQVQLSDSESDQDQTKAAAADTDRARAKAASERARKYSEDYARRSASRNVPPSTSRPDPTTSAKHTAEEVFGGLYEPPEDTSPRKKKKKSAANTSLSFVFHATTQPPNAFDASPNDAPRAKSAAPAPLSQTTSFSKYKGFDRPDGLGEASSSTGVKRKRASDPSEDTSKKKQAKLSEIKKELGGKPKGVIPNHMLHDDPITVTDSDVASSLGKSKKKRSTQPTSTEPKSEACEICRKGKRKCDKLPNRPDGSCGPCVTRGLHCSLRRPIINPGDQGNVDHFRTSSHAPVVKPNTSDGRPTSSSHLAVVVPSTQRHQQGSKRVNGIEASSEQLDDGRTPPPSFPFPSSQPRNSQRLPSSPPVDGAAAAGSNGTVKSKATTATAARDDDVDMANNEEASADRSPGSASAPQDDPNEQLEHEKLLGAWNRMTDKGRRQPTPAPTTQMPSSSKPKPASSKPRSSILRIEQESDSEMEGLPKNPQAPQLLNATQKPTSSAARPKPSSAAKGKKRDQANADPDESSSTSSGTHSSEDGLSYDQMAKSQAPAQAKQTEAPKTSTQAANTPRPTKPISSTPKPTAKAPLKKAKASSSDSTTSSDSMDEYDEMDERAGDTLTEEQKKRLAQIPLENRHRERMYMIGKSAPSTDAPQASQRASSPACAPATSSAPSAGWLSSVKKAVSWMNREDPWWEQAQEEARSRANA